jgi:hypothetical protein
MMMMHPMQCAHALGISCQCGIFSALQASGLLADVFTLVYRSQVPNVALGQSGSHFSGRKQSMQRQFFFF